MTWFSFLYPVSSDYKASGGLSQEDMDCINTAYAADCIAIKEYFDNRTTTIKTIYLASPYSHKSKRIMKQREIAVTKVAALLMDKHRVSFFLPITQSAAMQRYNPNLGNGSFAAWADIDLHEVALRDETWVCKLEGWDKSIGVLAEIKHARQLGKPVKFIDPDTLAFVGEND